MLLKKGMNSKTTVGDFMTSGAHSIGQEQTMNEAHKLMRDNRIRHLPVLHGGKLVGMVTERDLHLVESLKEVDASSVNVEEAMSQEVYTVTADALLSDVAATMHKKKLGSAIVLDGKKGKVIGVFTTTDALRALATLLMPAKKTPVRRATSPAKKAILRAR